MLNFIGYSQKLVKMIWLYLYFALTLKDFLLSFTSQNKSNVAFIDHPHHKIQWQLHFYFKLFNAYCFQLQSLFTISSLAAQSIKFQTDSSHQWHHLETKCMLCGALQISQTGSTWTKQNIIYCDKITYISFCSQSSSNCLCNKIIILHSIQGIRWGETLFSLEIEVTFFFSFSTVPFGNIPHEKKWRKENPTLLYFLNCSTHTKCIRSPGSLLLLCISVMNRILWFRILPRTRWSSFFLFFPL